MPATLCGQFKDRIGSWHRFSVSKKEQGVSPTSNKAKPAPKKKEQGASPAQKLCRPYFPEKLDLILIDGATLLVRARAPPETWTTRLRLAAASLSLHP
jgi:hypothetical protein